METKEKVNCKKFKKNKDPKCNDQPECNWEKGKGCLPKLIVRTQQEIITNPLKVPVLCINPLESTVASGSILVR